MEVEEHKRKQLLAKLKPHLEKHGGIFTCITRKRLLGMEGLSGRNRTKDDFWYDQRENVKMALIDLDLFTEAAPDDQANKVLTNDSLTPIIDDLLWNTLYFPLNPERNELYLERAKIAQLFIKAGFDYLSNMNPMMMTLSHKRTMDDALDLSRFLLETLNFRGEVQQTGSARNMRKDTPGS